MIAYGLCLGLLLGVFSGWMIGVTYPPCTPGVQSGCNTPEGASGVRYCVKSGFGWEPCQKFGQPYPQALWRQ
jgi:hypothetical protein